MSESMWWPNVETWTCPECKKSSPGAEWEEFDYPCDDCGSHDGRRCPRCDEGFDHVWGADRVIEASAR